MRLLMVWDRGRGEERDREKERGEGEGAQLLRGSAGPGGERCRCSGAVRGGAALPSRFTCGDPRAPLRC